MSASDILSAAAAHMQDRAATYDKPEGERSMNSTVLAFAAVTGVLMTEEQGWLFMALLKAVRSQQGAYRADSYEDGAAYFALAGEAACRDRNGGWAPEAIKAAALPHDLGQQNTIEQVFDPLKHATAEQIARQVSGGTIDPFDCAPEWAKYKAQDSNGQWYWFECAVAPAKTQWDKVPGVEGRVKMVDAVSPPNPNWRETLITRN